MLAYILCLKIHKKEERNEANDLADTRNQKVRLFEVQIVENLFGTTQVISVIMEK